MRRIVQAILVVFIVGAGAAGFLKLTASRPKIKRKRPTVPLPVVRVVKVRVGPHQMEVRGQGTVRPIREVSMAPEVGGKVVYVSPSLVDGGQFKKGQILLRIDPADYELAVTLARSKIKELKSNLRMLREEAEEARSEWEMNHLDEPTLAKQPPPLLVKEPQIAAVEAQLEAARANLTKACLDLKRTELVAPFDGRVTSEKVGIGQYVRQGEILATLYPTEAVEIPVPLERKAIQWFYVPGLSPGRGPGPLAIITARFGGKVLSWQGRVVRSSGRIDENSRMIHVIVRVNGPYARKPPLAVGLFVDVVIKGRILPHVAEIPAWALRGRNEVWVVKKGRLFFRKVHVARLDKDVALITSGLDDGDFLVVSVHREVTNGMRVRVEMAQEGES